MKLLNNQQGFALVTALMLTLITLTIVTSMLYLITRNVQVSGSQKRYRNVLEASYGGSEIVLKDVIPLILQGNTMTEIADEFPSDMNILSPSGITSLVTKLSLPTSKWPSTYNQTFNPKTSADITFNVPGTSAASTYNVYAKIVDSKEGNTDLSGLQLEGAGVAEAASVVTPQHFPNVYRVEVLAERPVKTSEQAEVSVLYAY